MKDVEGLLEKAVAALNGSPREGQQQMAEAVNSALESETHLLVQAGTGTGKSLGYLVPAVRYAVGSGERVIVSTATLALQAQIVDRDIPRLAKALREDLGRRPSAAVLKGRRNYLCKHKLAGGYPDDEAGLLFDMGADDAAHRGGSMSALESEIARIRSWEQSTDTGDRDDLVPGVSDRTWSHVSVNAYDCLGQKCPMVEECWAELARTKASGADVVVTNHALLAIDAFGENSVLPSHSAVIIDEAHELRDRVTSALTGSLTDAMLSAAHSAARKHTGATPAALSDFDTARTSFSDALDQAEAGLLRMWPEPLQDAVAALRDSARTLLSACGDAERGKEADSGLTVARARIQEVFDLAERMTDGSANDVVWVSRNSFRGTETVSLVIAPLSVAGTMRRGLFEEATVVATSATLALGGRFEPVAASLGLEGPDSPRYDSLDVGSPFDYPKQGILYVAGHLPKPGRGGLNVEQLEELRELIEASGGGALGLFSSKAAAEQAAEYMRENTDLPILLQGEDGLGSLVRSFSSDAESSLFGTISLWQGVDVPGDACRLVLIDRIPFPRPDDPLATARTEAAARRGANGFMAVSATHAALKLAQGAGRLIRSTSDRGVVAVLDSRLRTARYANFLMATLPPMWTTESPAVVRGALERLKPED